jgi:hypothetical protein
MPSTVNFLLIARQAADPMQQIASMIWIALAAQLSAPLLVGHNATDIRALFTADDMPDYVEMAGVDRIVLVRTTVGPDGRTLDCRAEISSGDTKLDAYTCALLTQRARFSPARSNDGSPAFGVVRAPLAWITSGSSKPKADPLKSLVPDVDLTVNELPGRRSAVGLDLVVAADESGRPQSCTANPTLPAKLSPTEASALVSAACRQVMKDFVAAAARDSSGKPAASVQTVSVRFQTAR